MRVMVIVKASNTSEAGRLPDRQTLAAMGRFNEQLAEAGILVSGDGLRPSSAGKRVTFAPGRPRVVTDGPFSETRELIAGFWIWNVASIDEAVEWVQRCPEPMPGEESDIEIRPLFEADDFGEALTPELREQEQRVAEHAQRRAAGAA
jgi:hypothetical protein